MATIKYSENKIPFIDLGLDYKIRLEYEDLTDEKSIEKARSELRESEETRNQAIEELRKLIKGKQKAISSY